MSVRRLNLPWTKVTLNLFEESYRRMGELYPTIGAQAAIRELVHAHVIDLDAKRARITETLVPEVNFEEKK